MKDNDDDELSEEAIYRQIEELLETKMNESARNITIEVDEDSVVVEGSVASIRSQEDLERLLFDTIDAEVAEYDVVVDEDLQSQDDPFMDETPGEEETRFESNPDLNNLSQSPRRQF